MVFSGRASEELRACLVHELVLRGVGVTETPGIAQWAMSPHLRRHPLGWLPLVLSDVEGQPDLPSYSAQGSSYSMPYGPSEYRDVAVIGGVHVPSVKETTTDTVAKGIGAAVANWADESNGRIEARAFEPADPLEDESVPSLLLALGLECLKGAGKKSGFRLRPVRLTRRGGCSSPPRPRGELTIPAPLEPTAVWQRGSPWPTSQGPLRAIPQRRSRHVPERAPGTASAPKRSGSSRWPGTSA